MNKKWIFSLCCLLAFGFCAKAQINESFTDGDFTGNPTWTGGTADWIVNAGKQLQSNNAVANSTFYLSTANTLATGAQWDFYNQISFNPSGANYEDVYLTASASDLTLTNTTGYFVRIGNTDDEISLYRKDASGAIVKIIDGVNGILNTSNNVMKIRVIRNAANQWTLSRDLTGTGAGYTSEGSVTDATYTTSSFFGILVKQSTASFFQRHFFDDITVQPYVPDVTPPSIVSATAITPNSLDVRFSEPVELTTAQTLANYSVNNGIGAPATAVRDAVNNALVHLTFTNAFPNGTGNTITINGVQDLAGNAIANGTATFSFYTPQQYDVVIDEIMADFSPPVALPANEWIELKNTSAFNINIQGWKISDATGASGPMPDYTLKPDSFVIVCTSTAFAAMSAYGPTITVTSFPSLNDDADQLVLTNAAGKTIHAVAYTSDWYQNDLKKNGGWTLEMIDTKNPCSGFSNWKASVDPKGGTPGKKNSIDALNKDVTAPRLLRAYATGPQDIVLVFDEPLDSTKAATAANYTISDGIGTPQTAVAIAPVFNKVNLHLATALQPGKVYTVTASNVSDCVGNIIGTSRTVRVGIAGPAADQDLVINEILFNPKSNGVDYVELYNRSNRIIDLKNIYIANRNTAGAISSISQLSIDSYPLFPADFVVITSDPSIVKRDFVALNPDAFVTPASMPSFNDDKGDVIILNEQGAIVDELVYSEKWHFPLIDNDEGVALERIDYNVRSLRTTNADSMRITQMNWHSAATSVGYGTPTYKNSQYRVDQEVQGTITVTPEIVSPDNDGTDDFATITYRFPAPGYVANITIFDAAGRPVRNLQRNALSGISGSYRWDGLGDKNQVLPSGIYIIYTEVFNLDGKKKRFKNTIVLARRN